MGKVILVLGPHGVGKTSLLKYANEHKKMIVFEGYQLPIEGADLSNPTEFILYQEKYEKRIIEDNSIIKESDMNGLVNRSIEESSYYYYFYQRYDEVKNHYTNMLNRNNKLLCDVLVYLDAPYSVLQDRYSKDDKRDMDETVEWYEKEYKRYDIYWKQYPGVKIIDTTEKTTEEIFSELCEIVKGTN